MTSDSNASTDEGGNVDVDPEEFLRALLKISPEDAEAVRVDTPTTRRTSQPETES